MSHDTTLSPAALTEVTAARPPSCTGCLSGCPGCLPWAFANCRDCRKTFPHWDLDNQSWLCVDCKYNAEHCQLCAARLGTYDNDQLRLCQPCYGTHCLGCNRPHSDDTKTVLDLCSSCQSFYVPSASRLPWYRRLMVAIGAKVLIALHLHPAYRRN